MAAAVGQTRSSDPQLTIKLPARIITYAWGDDYVDTLLTLTLPALLAPDNLPFVAAEVPCMMVILTERRFFKTFENHPVLAAIRQYCPVRLMKLDDLLSSSDSYGLSLTYMLHRGIGDLADAPTDQWQIFLNADFILANGSLRNLIAELSRGHRIVAAPSYCADAEEVIPALRTRLNSSRSLLSISHRELADLILRHRHKVIRAKTINQNEFHMRYMDQFYWDPGDDALLGVQMPVAIVGLRPERFIDKPNSYWDYGLIREFCPSATIRVLGDSDQFTMLELRKKAVAADQLEAGPVDMEKIVERMITWVTPYQRDFLRFPLTLHAGELPVGIEDERQKLQRFIDKIVSLAPEFPSHLDHPQWKYHRARFAKNRRTPLRVALRKVSAVARAILAQLSPVVRLIKRTIRPAAYFLLNRVLIPILARRRLRIVAERDIARYQSEVAARDARIRTLEAEMAERDAHISRLAAELAARQRIDFSAIENVESSPELAPRRQLR
jgi:hypothetical protein